VTPERLFDSVIAVAPGFRGVREEHMRDNDELLLHVLMSDLLRFVGSHFTGASTVPADPPTENDVKAVLQVLDGAITAGNADVENAIAVSFIEDIETEPFFDRLRPMLGPNLRAELQRQKSWRPRAR
jgi:hypothetical protein